MLWQLCLVFLGVYALFLRWKLRKFRKIYEQLPLKMKSVPILGHAVNLLGNSRDRMKGLQKIGRRAEDNDGITSLWLGNKFVVVIADPLAAEVVMKTCLEKDEMMNIARHLIGNGSIFAPVSIWRPRRKFLAPNFSQKTLNSFVKIFSKQGSILTDQLKTAVGKGNFSIFDNVTKYSMDSVSETALGVEVNSQRIPNHPVPKAFNQFCDLAAARITKPWFYSDAVYKWYWDFPAYDRCCTIMKKFVAKIIHSKRESMTKQNNNILEQDKLDSPEYHQKDTKTKSLLELLIETGGDKGFSNLELQEETLVMLLAGTDTSSVAASFAALLLAKYPDIQDKVYEEINEVIGDSKRHIESDDLPKFKYLDAVVRETLRMYPPVPFLVRNVEKDITLPSGVTLVPGVCALIHIPSLHRNPKYWGPDPNVFRPERFLEGQIKHPYAFIPFSNGPRNCLGGQYAMMSVKTVLAHLVRRYRLLPRVGPGDEGIDDKELPITFEIMMKHADNFELRLEQRK